MKDRVKLACCIAFRCLVGSVFSAGAVEQNNTLADNTSWYLDLNGGVNNRSDASDELGAFLVHHLGMRLTPSC